MSPSLLDYPPEIIINILTFLPVQSLLRFSATSRHSHSLATSSLHTLSLGIYTSHMSNTISCLSATQYPQPKHIASAFPSCSCPSPSPAPPRRRQKPSLERYTRTDAQRPADPYSVSVSIPDGKSYDATTLLLFHTALTKSILNRHGRTLQNLDITLWTLTVPVAKALASLPAIRTLSIRIEDFPEIRTIPRRLTSSLRNEERTAWSILAQTSAWAPQLRALRIEAGEIKPAQLFALLRRSRRCEELWLCKCPAVNNDVWDFLGREWNQKSRAALRILGIMRCGGQVNEKVLDMIGEMSGLQFLCLQGCQSVSSEDFEERNRRLWGILEVVPPLPPLALDAMSGVIEIDPLYLTSDD